MRAAPIIPVGPPAAYLARFPGGIGLPRCSGGSAPKLALSRSAPEAPYSLFLRRNFEGCQILDAAHFDLGILDLRLTELLLGGEPGFGFVQLSGYRITLRHLLGHGFANNQELGPSRRGRHAERARFLEHPA